MRRSHCGLVVVALYVLVLLYAVGGCQNPPSQQLNSAATTQTSNAVEPLLKEQAKLHPENAAAINALLANWNGQSERADYNAAKPYLLQEEVDRPDLKQSIDDKLYSWDRRLTTMGQ